jgi:hypothetical protein
MGIPNNIAAFGSNGNLLGTAPRGSEKARQLESIPGSVVHDPADARLGGGMKLTPAQLIALEHHTEWGR